jgi:pimeloyl-ACP methyl ester carboxylesterase
VAPVIIVPGLGGSDDDHWQTHLERSFNDAIRVHQDDWHKPDLSSWLARLEECIEARPGAILVAHSLGCILVAHLAARRPDLSIAAAVLVAPADVEVCRDTLRTTRTFTPPAAASFLSVPSWLRAQMIRSWTATGLSNCPRHGMRNSSMPEQVATSTLLPDMDAGAAAKISCAHWQLA